ncbi:hypothetical protein NE237_008169 [Protea cynaroides]|uniref:Uncharacterized protein n=1 Tax=Protea cynaroides TaxID=273540 RepID=A0A9Q0QWU1_9MAGN|nr:hypothetical protein NE237_008169 [Protea cynaroides]
MTTTITTTSIFMITVIRNSQASAGSMLGDDFLHQLPHAYAGIVLFLLVEKVVRYAEACSGNGGKGWGRGHHYHHHKSIKKLDKHDADDSQVLHSIDEKDGGVTDKLSNGEVSDGVSGNCLNEEKHAQLESLLHKRTTDTGARHHDKPGFDAANSLARKLTPSTEKGLESSSSNLVFGYLNLFSDGVYNFTDGIAHASAFLLYGTVGGLSRTLFLLSHELPQEVGDSGILIRSGFSAPNALIFNFLSALVALAATVLGFTAGGFIYIAVSVAGVLPEMNSRNITGIHNIGFCNHPDMIQTHCMD